MGVRIGLCDVVDIVRFSIITYVTLLLMSNMCAVCRQCLVHSAVSVYK